MSKEWRDITNWKFEQISRWGNIITVLNKSKEYFHQDPGNISLVEIWSADKGSILFRITKGMTRHLDDFRQIYDVHIRAEQPEQDVLSVLFSIQTIDHFCHSRHVRMKRKEEWFSEIDELRMLTREQMQEKFCIEHKTIINQRVGEPWGDLETESVLITQDEGEYFFGEVLRFLPKAVAPDVTRGNLQCHTTYPQKIFRFVQQKKRKRLASSPQREFLVLKDRDTEFRREILLPLMTKKDINDPQFDVKDDLERHQWYVDYKVCLSKQGVAVLANDDRLKRAKCHFYCMKMLENT